MGFELDKYKDKKKIVFLRQYLNAGLQEAQAGIKIAGRNINNLRYADDYPYGTKGRGTKRPLERK